ncbi:MAG: N-acetylglucosamine-6-phosphate deacetylase [Synechococcales cyanobacterium K44_A2020_017]|nr:N-acetylglucosamine-6-phosphate deacetylase [Synechococcales cyanobacterium K32_A2020_035]MBF2094061.1 N-acetylglucosamine-6-phosphate deacetylase [Synechococcales cyanobacterium K44_A2020_017]
MAAQSSTIINARLPDRDGLHQLCLTAGRLTRIQPMDEAIAPDDASLDDAVLDVDGDWISPGGVDLQINGALGLAFPDLAIAHLETLDKICGFLWQQGVDAFLPTLVTTSLENIHRALATVAAFGTQGSDRGARILGVHLEGPFLNPQKRGAHPAEHLRPLTLEQVSQVLANYASLVKVITLAPELDSSGQVLPTLVNQGMIVSLGHSQATAEQAKRAFDQGASMVTHAFNAMPSLHHRQPGLLGAALTHPQVFCGVIADGVHVAPTMLDLLIRIGRGGRSPQPYPQGLFLVSDALAPLGLPDGRYPWDSREIEVTQGTARLANGTLSGTTLPLLAGVQYLVRQGICAPSEAIALATLAPRRALGLPAWPQQEPIHLLRWKAQTLDWQRLS